MNDSPRSVIVVPDDEDDDSYESVRKAGRFSCWTDLSRKAKKRWKIGGIVFIVLGILFLLLAFVVFPIVFMESIELQRLLMFTNLGLPTSQSYFEHYNFTGLRNLYVSVQDTDDVHVISLGVWHLLPELLANRSMEEEDFDFEAALYRSNFSVLLYFHGNGEARSYSANKYLVLRRNFHIIAFDYRSYADSTDGVLSEDAVVSDCVQLYKWLFRRTESPIFLWGHSLGTALATRTAHILRQQRFPVTGLTLEAPFTKMSDELYVHPIGRIFAWLPWFKATVVDPLRRNGFTFDSARHILGTDFPVMILHAEDDSVVPYKLGHQLFKIAQTRGQGNISLYFQFPYDMGHDHYFIYEDPFLPFLIAYFEFLCKAYAHILPKDPQIGGGDELQLKEDISLKVPAESVWQYVSILLRVLHRI